MSEDFPWGDRLPLGGYQIGDYVGLIYSDHEEYIFDNPTGTVTQIEGDCVDADHSDPCTECQRVTVQVEAVIGAERLYLIERGLVRERSTA
jgi:hypothetical protein